MDSRNNGYQRRLAFMVYNFFDERTKGSGIESDKRFPESSRILNKFVKILPEDKILAEELHKPIIRNFKRRKVYSTFKDHILGVDLADMSLINKFNKGINYLL